MKVKINKENNVGPNGNKGIEINNTENEKEINQLYIGR